MGWYPRVCGCVGNESGGFVVCVSEARILQFQVFPSEFIYPFRKDKMCRSIRPTCYSVWILFVCLVGFLRLGKT